MKALSETMVQQFDLSHLAGYILLSHAYRVFDFVLNPSSVTLVSNVFELQLGVGLTGGRTSLKGS